METDGLRKKFADTVKTEPCPLCAFNSCIAEDTSAVTFDCPICLKFRISRPAMDRLKWLSDAQRGSLISEVWQSHLLGKVLEITLAPPWDFKVFKRVRI